MKAFRFRLQTLLELRQAEEDQLAGELAELRREEALDLSRLHRLIDRHASACERVREALVESAAVEEIERRDEYAKTLRDDIRVQELTIEAVRKRIEAKREELVEAMKQRQVIESLRGKQESAYLAAQAAIEQKQLDETASVRYARRV